MKRLMNVTILGPNLPSRQAAKGTLHVHATGCLDIMRRYSTAIRHDLWTIDAESKLDVVTAIYPPDDFIYNPDDERQYAPYIDVYFAPCVTLPFEVEP